MQVIIDKSSKIQTDLYKNLIFNYRPQEIYKQSDLSVDKNIDKLLNSIADKIYNNFKRDNEDNIKIITPTKNERKDKNFTNSMPTIKNFLEKQDFKRSNKKEIVNTYKQDKKEIKKQ